MSPRKAAALRGGDRTLREHLIATAERMIAERGTAGLTVRAIAQEAGVAGGVLYNHFADKEELIALALRARATAIESGLDPLPAPGTGTVEGNLRAYVAHGLALHGRLVPALTGLIATPEVLARFAGLSDPDRDWRHRLRGYLEAERGLGRIAAGAPVDAATSMIVGACHEPVLSALFQGRGIAEPSPRYSVDDLVAAVLAGIGPREAAGPGPA
ncbi:TetR/AcrR family transcriptional regulator [Actinomadura montaniterrae]|uniref:TetR/AcrR family transcriptional regulator n=1 Tax=Actinomadura montaniterrae TaxID=1803903 RepID=A0A6L3W2L1_9ACTN|nr:TetR/AcrR family transcriptional regulator [Actinomadura montaniterrae]KAB2387807.1 TetR/AcrR family transcriptional regulator [Actinomadura montaniterrae]